jgi:hypothetical protein
VGELALQASALLADAESSISETISNKNSVCAPLTTNRSLNC